MTKRRFVMLLQIVQLPAIALLKVVMTLVALVFNSREASVPENMLDWNENTTRKFWIVMALYIAVIVIASLLLASLNALSGAAFFVVMVISSFALFGTPSASSKQ